MPGGAQVQDPSFDGDISATGRFVVLATLDDELVMGPAAGKVHIVLVDRDTGAISPVSARPDGQPANLGIVHPAIDGFGRYAVFMSSANDLAPGLTVDTTWDVFRWDRFDGSVELVSAAADGTDGDGDCGTPFISANGRYVGFVAIIDLSAYRNHLV